MISKELRKNFPVLRFQSTSAVVPNPFVVRIVGSCGSNDSFHDITQPDGQTVEGPVREAVELTGEYNVKETQASWPSLNIKKTLCWKKNWTISNGPKKPF